MKKNSKFIESLEAYKILQNNLLNSPRNSTFKRKNIFKLNISTKDFESMTKIKKFTKFKNEKLFVYNYRYLKWKLS